MISKRLFILEGPDGGGKSTLAAQLATWCGGDPHAPHLGPFPRVGKRGLARLYVEAMLPALLGHRDVIMDRCWLSEPIYAQARRHEPSRLCAADLRMLERIAARCATTVVLCLPSKDVCLAAYRERRPTEYLKSEAELGQVWDLYAVGMRTTLPTCRFDFTDAGAGLKTAGGQRPAAVASLVAHGDRTEAHPLAAGTAGHLDAPVLIVGPPTADVGEHDPLATYPLVGFDDGPERWATAQLDRAGIPERNLLWASADHDLRQILAHPIARPRFVVSLGDQASRAVDDSVGFMRGREVLYAADPRRHRRDGPGRPWNLIQYLEARL